ncbi:MAG: DUF6680 family protein [Novosphingobium sp.]
MTSEPLYLGLKYGEFITTIALIVGPVLAIALQLAAEARKQVRERQLQTMRMLVGTRHLAGDPRWSEAVNMVPIDFNDNKKIMSAWREYWRVIRYQSAPEQRQVHMNDVKARQTQLIFEVLKCLRYKVPETEIIENAYAADGLVQRDNLMLAGWEAWPRIANALEQNNAMIAASLNAHESSK